MANPSSVTDLVHPIGRLKMPEAITSEVLNSAIDDLSQLPAQFREAAAALSPAQLASPYRPGGWTGRQVIHHLADSHMQAFSRVKLALTQERPTIVAYSQDLWASTSDSSEFEIEPSLAIIDGVHARLVALLRNLDEGAWKREFLHPELGPRTVAATALLYAWHGKHHTAHLELLKQA